MKKKKESLLKIISIFKKINISGDSQDILPKFNEKYLDFFRNAWYNSLMCESSRY